MYEYAVEWKGKKEEKKRKMRIKWVVLFWEALWMNCAWDFILMVKYSHLLSPWCPLSYKVQLDLLKKK